MFKVWHSNKSTALMVKDLSGRNEGVRSGIVLLNQI